MRSNHSSNQAISRRMGWSDQRRGTPFQRIRTRRGWRAAQLAVSYPRCKKRWRPTAARILQPIPGPTMGILVQGLSAVRAYQTDRGVIADGVVGDQTWWVPAGAAGRTLAS